MSNWFRKDKHGRDRVGILMRLEDDQHTRYKFEIWFEYTRQAMNEIREGTMLTVPNYATTRDETHYSVLEVTGIKPIHYAIGENPSGFPGFVMEAARSASEDWTGQDDEPTEDTTTIQCTAIPTGLEIREKNGELNFDPEKNIPMVGARVLILNTEATQKVVNRDIKLEIEREGLFTGGKLLLDSAIDVYVRRDDFVRVHFGIFGFTGAGKSNLLSTYIAELLQGSQPIKIVFFDLMSEYTVLLIDQLLKSKISGRILSIGQETLPEGVYQYINEDKSNTYTLEEAIEQLHRYTLLPKALARYRDQVKLGMKKLLQDKILGVFAEAHSMTVWDLFFTAKAPWGVERRSRKHLRDSFTKDILRMQLPKVDYKKKVFDPDLARKLKTAFETRLNAEGKDWKEDFDPILKKLEELAKQTAKTLAAGVSLDTLVNDLNDESSSSLWIIQAHNPTKLRDFAKDLGDKVYESRRLEGKISPLVSFVFDEADEFIPREAKDSYAHSKEIAETLARRGRKFGLGIGIATQRTRYLDTNIMAQPHTYLISKLPRKSDREVVAEAFGISEDMFQQTFKFLPGNWLLISHDATGLKAIPVPVKTDDANQRVIEYLKSLD